MDDNAFNICLDIVSPDGVTVEPWFDTVVQAKERWESIITAEAPWGVTGHARSKQELEALNEDFLDRDLSALPDEGVDDLYVIVEVADGALPGDAGA